MKKTNRKRKYIICKAGILELLSFILLTLIRIFVFLIGNYEENDLLVRLLKPYEEKLSSQKKDTNEAFHTAMASNTPACTAGLNESKKSKAVTEQYIQIKPPATTSSQSKMPVTNKSQLKSPVATSVTTKSRIKSKTTVKSHVAPVTTTYHEHLPNRSFEQAHKEIKTMLKSKVNLHEREEYAKLLLWDFAGDEEFYHTHQTFLSPDSIYLVVTKLNEAAEKNSQGKTLYRSLALPCDVFC